MPQYTQLKYAFEGINIKPSAGKPSFITFKMTEPQFQQFQANQTKGIPEESPDASQASDDGESIQVTIDESEIYLHAFVSLFSFAIISKAQYRLKKWVPIFAIDKEFLNHF